MQKAIAIGASVAVLALLGGTYAAIQMRAPDPCGNTAIAGGAIGGPFTLVNEDGATVTDAEVITEPALVYFGFTFCPDVCPLDSARNAAATDILAEQGISVTPVFVSVDPERDTPEVMKAYTDNFHPKMIGLTGSEEQVREAAQAYRVVYSRADDDPEYYLIDHSVFTYLVTPEEGFVQFFRRDTSPEAVAEQVACQVGRG